jgi:predicted lipoprotein with Yx(FWY)xxD motif
MEDKIKIDETGRNRSTHEKDENCIQNCGLKPERKWPPYIPRHKWKEILKW